VRGATLIRHAGRVRSRALAKKRTPVCITNGWQRLPRRLAANGAPSDRHLKIPMFRKTIISKRFSKSASTYDCNSALQNAVAERLCGIMPTENVKRILEVGCGTGNFTRHLIDKYPNARLAITDISKEMLMLCAGKYKNIDGLEFDVMDGEHIVTDRAFDIIASSMSLQWFDNPIEGIARQRANLTPCGSVLYATVGPDNFPEWRNTLEALHMPAGLLQMPQLPGCIFEERIPVDYGNAKNFLAVLKATGAHQPRAGYRPLSPSALKHTCAEFDRLYAGRITWHIVYGRVRKNKNS
jgi:malonyl-CoA O-methyltransferase